VSVQAQVNALSGAQAPPRSNGELVFEEPWQARVFGLAIALVQAQGLDWEEFRRRLIEEIAAGQDAGGGYYEHWLAALERLVIERGLLREAELEHEAARVAGADRHEHDAPGG